MCKNLKQTMYKELKVSKKTMSRQIENMQMCPALVMSWVPISCTTGATSPGTLSGMLALPHRWQKPFCSRQMACSGPGNVCWWAMIQDHNVSWETLRNLWVWGGQSLAMVFSGCLGGVVAGLAPVWEPRLHWLYRNYCDCAHPFAPWNLAPSI